jgi:methyl-accepting chemotaxis protein
MASLNLRVKILISLIVITLLFACGMVLFAETFIYHKLNDTLREKGIALAKRVAADCVNPVITERHFEITMMFKDLMDSEPDIVYAYVLSEDGRELTHTFAKGLPKELKLAHEADLHQPYSARDLSTDKGIVLDIAVPLLKGQIGVLHLGLSDSAIARDVDEIVTAIVVFSVAVLLAGIVVSVGFSRAITAPLVKLAGAAEAFGRGEMDREIVITSNDEFGDLARIFNTMIEKRRQADTERERLILELQEAIKKVKTLSGLLPLCSSCKKIRDDKGYWNQIDAYISEHSDAEISHSLCPECAKKLYPDIWERMRKSNRE